MDQEEGGSKGGGRGQGVQTPPGKLQAAIRFLEILWSLIITIKLHSISKETYSHLQMKLCSSSYILSSFAKCL